MLQLKYTTRRDAFEYPFALTKGIKTHQPALLVCLTFNYRFKGYGETTEISYASGTIEEMADILEQNKAAIERYALNSPQRFWHFLHHLLPDHPFLVSALDMAGWDLWGKMNGKTVQELMGISMTGQEPPTSYTIGWTDPETVAERVRRHPFPAYKLKIGGPEDVPALAALRAATDAAIRVDANEGLTLTEALRLLPELERREVTLIEQPLPRDDREGIAELRKHTRIPIIADEACRGPEDLTQALACCDGVNIKLSKCGGLTPALQMIQTIKAAGKKVMLGGMCENIPGATAIAQLLPLADYADIDGPLLLKEPTAKGLTYHNGYMQLPNRAGLGIKLLVPF